MGGLLAHGIPLTFQLSAMMPDSLMFLIMRYAGFMPSASSTALLL